MEERTVKDFEDYTINTEGQVFSIRSNRFLNPITTAKGYLQVNLTKGKKRKSIMIHQLVAEAFLDKPDNYGNGFIVINHIDGNKQNNNVSNLEYTTQQNNVIHGFSTGLNINVGYNHPRSLKLPNETIDLIVRLSNEGNSGAAIGRMVGISADSARRIIKNPQKYYN